MIIYILLVFCDKHSGRVIDGRVEKLGIIESFNICLDLVKSVWPTANGITWYKKSSKNCYARFGATRIKYVPTANSVACLFSPGKTKDIKV